MTEKIFLYRVEKNIFENFGIENFGEISIEIQLFDFSIFEKFQLKSNFFLIFRSQKFSKIFFKSTQKYFLSIDFQKSGCFEKEKTVRKHPAP